MIFEADFFNKNGLRSDIRTTLVFRPVTGLAETANDDRTALETPAEATA